MDLDWFWMLTIGSRYKTKRLRAWCMLTINHVAEAHDTSSDGTSIIFEIASLTVLRAAPLNLRSRNDNIR
jgi:hypothetical protein